MISHSGEGDFASSRRFQPPLYLQRYNCVAAIVQQLCMASSVFDVGCSTGEFTAFALAPTATSSEFFNPTTRYSALDLHAPSVRQGARVQSDEMLAKDQAQTGGWFPRLASFYCGNVFALSAPSKTDCPSYFLRQGKNHQEDRIKADVNADQEGDDENLMRHAPHAEVIVCIDVIEHIPFKIDLNDLVVSNSASASEKKEEEGEKEQEKLQEEDGPQRFLDWLLHVAPCPLCTRAVVVTTPNYADNVPVLGMNPKELRHWDHKFEWDLKEYSQVMRQSCRKTKVTNSSEKETKGSTNNNNNNVENNNNNKKNEQMWKIGAWIHFGMGGTATQGIIALQQEALDEALAFSEAGGGGGGNEENDNQEESKNLNNNTASEPRKKKNKNISRLWHLFALLYQLDREKLSTKKKQEDEEEEVEAEEEEEEEDELRREIFSQASLIFSREISYGKMLRFETLPRVVVADVDESESDEKMQEVPVLEEQTKGDDPLTILDFLDDTKNSSCSEKFTLISQSKKLKNTKIPLDSVSASASSSSSSTTATSAAELDSSSSSPSQFDDDLNHLPFVKLLNQYYFCNKKLWNILYDAVDNAAKSIACDIRMKRYQEQDDTRKVQASSSSSAAAIESGTEKQDHDYGYRNVDSNDVDYYEHDFDNDPNQRSSTFSRRNKTYWDKNNNNGGYSDDTDNNNKNNRLSYSYERDGGGELIEMKDKSNYNDPYENHEHENDGFIHEDSKKFYEKKLAEEYSYHQQQQQRLLDSAADNNNTTTDDDQNSSANSNSIPIPAADAIAAAVLVEPVGGGNEADGEAEQGPVVVQGIVIEQVGAGEVLNNNNNNNDGMIAAQPSLSSISDSDSVETQPDTRKENHHIDLVNDENENNNNNKNIVIPLPSSKNDHEGEQQKDDEATLIVRDDGDYNNNNNNNNKDGESDNSNKPKERISFSQVVNHYSVKVALDNIPLAALAFVHLQGGEDSDALPLDCIERRILKTSSTTTSSSSNSSATSSSSSSNSSSSTFSSSRLTPARIAAHIKLSIASEKYETRGNNQLAKSISYLRQENNTKNQKKATSLLPWRDTNNISEESTVSLLQALSDEEIEWLLWAAVFGFYECIFDDETGEKIIFAS